jgi:hypothetical protein
MDNTLDWSQRAGSRKCRLCQWAGCLWARQPCHLTITGLNGGLAHVKCPEINKHTLPGRSDEDSCTSPAASPYRPCHLTITSLNGGYVHVNCRSSVVTEFSHVEDGRLDDAGDGPASAGYRDR